MENKFSIKKSIELAIMQEKHEHLKALIVVKESQERAFLVQKIANDQVLKDTSDEFEKKLASKMRLQRLVTQVTEEKKHYEKVKNSNLGALKIDREIE